MKSLTYLFAGSVIVCGLLIILSCKKQHLETKADLSIAPLQIAATTECRPAVFGAISSSTGWLTLAQKWYSSGKVKYLKAKSARFTSTFFNPFLELMYEFEWAEVLYQGNQVYLRDQLNDHALMRVTLDDQGRPAASYYYYQQVGTLTYWYDTTYYYYNGSRLDEMISLYHTNQYNSHFPVHSFRKYKFSYDTWGTASEASSFQ